MALYTNTSCTGNDIIVTLPHLKIIILNFSFSLEMCWDFDAGDYIACYLDSGYSQDYRDLGQEFQIYFKDN